LTYYKDREQERAEMAETNTEHTTKHLSVESHDSSSSAQIMRLLSEVRGDLSGLRTNFSDLRSEFHDLREFVDARVVKPTQPLGKTIEEIHVGVHEANSKIEEVMAGVNKIDRTISVLSRDIVNVRADVTNHESRLSNLEAGR
jgi:archaellum component FlaC